jgi:hypothetical protein
MMMRRDEGIARCVWRIGWLVPRGARADWREEWLAELHGTDRAAWPDAGNLLRGAAYDALLLRLGAPDEWARDARRAALVLARHPAATIASVWVLGLWVGVATMLLAAARAMVARPSPSLLAPERGLLLASAVVALSTLSAAAARAVRGLLADLPRAECLRQRLTVGACLGCAGGGIGVGLVSLALARLALR